MLKNFCSKKYFYSDIIIYTFMLEIIELNPKDYLVSIYQKMLTYLILVIKIALLFKTIKKSLV